MRSRAEAGTPGSPGPRATPASRAGPGTTGSTAALAETGATAAPESTAAPTSRSACAARSVRPESRGRSSLRRRVVSITSAAVIAEHDVLVIGAGCAGMRAAIAAHDAGADVAMISKLHPTRSHSGAAEGGINAALGNAAEDNPEIHAFDTVKGSDYLGDQDAIEILCDEAPGDVYQLENWGAVFSRTEDGRIAQRPFGAAGAPRTAYAADITGHVLIQVLWEQICKRDIPTYEE